MGSLAAWGYGLASVAYLILSAMLALAWQGRSSGLLLLGAAIATSIWAAVLGWSSPAQNVDSKVFLAEILRQGAWLALVLSLIHTRRGPERWVNVAYPLFLALLAAVILAGAHRSPLFRTTVMLGGVGLSFLTLLLLELAYRRSGEDGRWALRNLYIGVGIFAVYDLYLYSEGLLLGAIGDAEWAARGFAFLLAVPFIAVAARRNPHWSLKVFVSRDVAFYATSATLVGGYLLLMGVGGYAVRMAGGEWGAAAQLVFLVAAAAILAVLVGSEGLRRRIKVFLVKNFYHHKYEYRYEWLRFMSALTNKEGSDDTRRVALRAVAQIVASPGAAYVFCQRAGSTVPVIEWPAGSPCEEGLDQLGENRWLRDLLDRREWVIDLDEYRDPAVRDADVLLPRWLLQSDWRLVVPAMVRDRLHGMLLLRRPATEFSVNFEDRDLLKTVARHAAGHLAQHEIEQRLAESRQFEAFSKLNAFVLHDLKNVTAQLGLVLANAERHRDEPGFMDDALESVQAVRSRMARLVERLQQGKLTRASRALDPRDLVQRVVGRCQDRLPGPVVGSCAEPLEVMASDDALAEALEHVIRNAQDATEPGGRVEVSVGRRDDGVVIEVSDTGTGMTRDFIETRLFRPFFSTKGAAGAGIGAYQVLEYVRGIGGSVEVRSTPGQGTQFFIILPAAASSRRGHVVNE